MLASGGEVGEDRPDFADAVRRRLDASLKDGPDGPREPENEAIAEATSAVKKYKDFPLKVRFPRGGVYVSYRGKF